MDPEIVVTAIKRYAWRRDKNIPQLMLSARQFGVAKLIRTYLEAPP
jgi:hypothetical protein